MTVLNNLCQVSHIDTTINYGCTYSGFMFNMITTKLGTSYYVILDKDFNLENQIVIEEKYFQFMIYMKYANWNINHAKVLGNKNSTIMFINDTHVKCHKCSYVIEAYDHDMTNQCPFGRFQSY